MDISEKIALNRDDAPLIALALSVENKGIWTFNIKHFKNVQSLGIKLLNIKRSLRSISQLMKKEMKNMKMSKILKKENKLIIYQGL